MKKTLLVAVDGSEPSLKGLGVAAQLARALGLDLELVNVQPLVLLAPSVYAETIRLIEEAQALASRDVLTVARAEVARLGGPEARTRSLTGSPAEAISELALEEHVWGVAIGAKGHGALGRVLLGSTADRLVHICHKPVLVVR